MTLVSLAMNEQVLTEELLLHPLIRKTINMINGISTGEDTSRTAALVQFELAKADPNFRDALKHLDQYPEHESEHATNVSTVQNNFQDVQNVFQQQLATLRHTRVVNENMSSARFHVWLATQALNDVTASLARFKHDETDRERIYTSHDEMFKDARTQQHVKVRGNDACEHVQHVAQAPHHIAQNKRNILPSK
jgi:hypothetical protein